MYVLVAVGLMHRMLCGWKTSEPLEPLASQQSH